MCSLYLVGIQLQASAQTGPRKVPEGFKQVSKGSPMYYNDKRQALFSSLSSSPL